MHTNNNSLAVKRPLTDAEMEALLTAISNAASTADLLHVAVIDLYTALLADEGKTLADFNADHRLDPSRYAIPEIQRSAIETAITDRAAQWGTSAELALQLVDLMPSSYDDPAVKAPVVPHTDHRPHLHQLEVTREAIDAMAAVDSHIGALGQFYGHDSAVYLEALESWHTQLSHLFALGFGAYTRISRDGDRSLLVRTGCGLVYGVVFHGQHRRCTDPDCGALIADDGTATAFSSTTAVRDHEHRPSYPLNGPRPGSWSFHS
jgi:hypothetical protein